MYATPADAKLTRTFIAALFGIVLTIAAPAAFGATVVRPSDRNDKVQFYARQHHCSADAMTFALTVLNVLADGDDRAAIDKNAGVTVRAPVKPLRGKGMFDVLEVTGHVYKGDYRIRVIYAQLPDECVHMGFEILQVGDPY